jgi:hypothetical protein
MYSCARAPLLRDLEESVARSKDCAQNTLKIQSRDSRTFPIDSKSHISRDAGQPSPEEGVELIRAFLRIEQREVRVAVVDLVKRLSGNL